MKILVVADIHANYRALKATLDAFDNVDEVWCLGDIVEYGPMPSACIDLVRQHCDQVVVGNHDLSFAKCQPQADDDWTVWFPHNTSINNLDYLNNLPTLLTLERDGISYCLVHGSPSNHLTGRFHPYTEEAENRQNLQYPDQDRILAGHTHMAMQLEIDGKLVANPGTIGQPRDGDYRAQCIVIEDGQIQYHRVDYDLDLLAQDYQHSAMNPEQADIWFFYTRNGIVDVHGLQLGPFSPVHPI